MAKKHRMKPEIEFTTEEVEEKISKKEEAHRKFATVKDVDILNIRQEPNGEIISQVGKNVPMVVVSETSITDKDNVDWYEVALPIGVVGFAMGRYLFIYEEGPVKEV